MGAKVTPAPLSVSSAVPVFGMDGP
eukprot:COSAG04_NODE_14814_length_554_cov_0.918681_1_plen_24_part_01